MSNRKTRHTVPVPGARTTALTEDEELRIRGIIRELHEATKDARAAAKELDEKMNRYGGTVTRHYRKVIAESDKRLMAEVEQHSATIQRATEEATKDIKNRIANLFGTADADTFLTALTLSVVQSMTPVVEKAAAKAANVKTFQRIVADEVKKSLDQESIEVRRKRLQQAAAKIDELEPLVSRFAKVGGIDIVFELTEQQADAKE